MVEPILQAIQAADSVLIVQLPATLAGLTLAAMTFLTLMLANLQDSLSQLKERLGQERSKTDSEVKQLEQKIPKVREGAHDFYRAFLLFLTSLVLMLAVFDTVLQASADNIVAEVVDVGATGTPFTGALIFLLQGAMKIKKNFLTTESSK